MQHVNVFKQTFELPLLQRITRSRRKGISMIEILGALAIAAFVIGGGVVLFNTAADRAEGANIAQSLQGFIVDMNAYLNQTYRDTWTVAPGQTIDEGDLQNDVVAEASRRVLGSTAGGTIADIPATDWGGTVAAPNANLLRFTNLPSVRFFESTASSDPDDDDEWTLYVNEDTTYDMAFAITPMALDIAAATTAAVGTADTEQFKFGTTPAALQVDMNTITQITAGAAVGDGSACPAPADPTLPDTAVAVAIALEDIDICEQVANRIQRFDHVQDSWCLDEDTSPRTFANVAAADGTAAAQDVQGDATLHICFGVQN